MYREEIGHMEPRALIRQLASVLQRLIAPRYRPELHYMRGPGPACRRRSNAVQRERASSRM